MNASKSTTNRPTQDLHVLGVAPLISPAELARTLPADEDAVSTVLDTRDTIKKILLGQDDRLLVIVGPCSIHDTKAALEYAERLNTLRQKVEDRLVVVMRVYFEKPRTTTGWKGLISDPQLDGTLDLAAGLHTARKLLVDINDMGLPAATEFLDPIVPQYIADLISWAAIGARTTESQTHRQMASGLSMPVGFKNATSGDIQIAINAMLSSRAPHSFVGVDHDGRCCVVSTTGNRWGHAILRGGEEATNFDPADVADAVARLTAGGLPGNVMIDCSHANSSKKHEKQEVAWHSAVSQKAAGQPGMIGMMLESHLNPGAQKLGDDPAALEYGVSITDACIGWDETEALLLEAHETLA